jgi:hypothetical protein
MKRLLFTILLTAGSLLAAVAQPVQGARPDKERFAHPTMVFAVLPKTSAISLEVSGLLSNL